MRDKNRQVANDTDAACMAVIAQRLPLPKEQELEELLRGNRISPFRARVFQTSGLSLGQFAIPTRPGAAAVFLLERAKQCLVVKPPGRKSAEVFELSAKFACWFAFEVLVCLSEQLVFELSHGFELDAIFGQGRTGDVFGREQTVGDQLARID